MNVCTHTDTYMFTFLGLFKPVTSLVIAERGDIANVNLKLSRIFFFVSQCEVSAGTITTFFGYYH